MNVPNRSGDHSQALAATSASCSGRMLMSLAGPAQFVSPVVLPPVLVTRASTSKALRPFSAPAVFPPSTMLEPLLMFGFNVLPFRPRWLSGRCLRRACGAAPPMCTIVLVSCVRVR